MANRYAVVCATCPYRSFHSSRWEADIDAAAHLRDNPTHSTTVVQGDQRVTTRDVRLAERLQHTRARGGQPLR